MAAAVIAGPATLATNASMVTMVANRFVIWVIVLVLLYCDRLRSQMYHSPGIGWLRVLLVVDYSWWRL
ncbi:protein of unknown function [Nitrospira defluvii]|uniref:Uncharacterized protein n=1 Tax=Nitrospira defluvii TaxID=330214 RepID=D8PGB5_9BACT|nr:protein of unknown function [Nitrospira defluvii]